MNERVKELRKALGLSGEEFGNRLGVGRSAVSNIENGYRTLTEQMIKSICREFNVREEWLRHGSGPMIMENNNYSLDDFARSKNATDFELEIIKMYFDLNENLRQQVAQHFRQGLAAMLAADDNSAVSETDTDTHIIAEPLVIYPYIIGGASAGLTSFLTDIEIESIKAPICDDADFIISVSGDSMEPTYYDREKVYVKKTPELNIGDIGIFSRGNELFIKEYGEKGLISHNPKYKMIKGAEDIQIIGRVIRKVTTHNK